jgi:hypothetical protein
VVLVTALVLPLSVAVPVGSLLVAVGSTLVPVAVGFVVVLASLPEEESPPSPLSLPRPAASKEQAVRMRGRSAMRRGKVSEAMGVLSGAPGRRRGQVAW